jgi:hypothetical protein
MDFFFVNVCCAFRYFIMRPIVAMILNTWGCILDLSQVAHDFPLFKFIVTWRLMRGQRGAGWHALSVLGAGINACSYSGGVSAGANFRY